MSVDKRKYEFSYNYGELRVRKDDGPWVYVKLEDIRRAREEIPNLNEALAILSSFRDELMRSVKELQGGTS